MSENTESTAECATEDAFYSFFTEAERRFGRYWEWEKLPKEDSGWVWQQIGKLIPNYRGLPMSEVNDKILEHWNKWDAPRQGQQPNQYDPNEQWGLYDDLCDKVKALIRTVHHNACVNTIRESAKHWGIPNEATRPAHPPIDTIMKDGSAGIEKDFTKP